MVSRPRTQPEPSAAGCPPPAWARSPAAGQTLEETAFLAGAGLAVLHPIARDPHPVGTLWRQRLALAAAAGLAKLAGRTEDAETLRDHWYLRRPGDDPGPAGRLLAAWRALATPAACDWRRLPALLELGADPALEAVVAFASSRREGEGPVAAAAGVAAESLRLRPDSRPLALWLADAVLAERLGWPAPVPLLAAHVGRADLRLGGAVAVAGGSGEAWAIACYRAYARAAITAADLHADLGRRAARLLAVAPKLRGRHADAIVARLLEEDALGATAGGPGSDRAQRRLFDRLVALGGVRELTGRATFRLYGL